MSNHPKLFPKFKQVVLNYKTNIAFYMNQVITKNERTFISRVGIPMNLVIHRCKGFMIFLLFRDAEISKK